MPALLNNQGEDPQEKHHGYDKGYLGVHGSGMTAGRGRDVLSKADSPAKK